ncbi:MAG: amidohydrolase family protein, partial [Clostridia bacterium]|nr:amidohydrolase family protein [Clostridia bacterium]
IAAHFHAHRADDIFTAIRIADEFGLKLKIVHGTDAACIADRLAARGIDVFVGPIISDRSKPELRSKSDSTAAELNAAGVRVSITTDHNVVPIQHLLTSAQIAIRAGLPKSEAFRAVTVNPAAALGLSDRIGRIAVGLDADFSVFAEDPFESIAAKPVMVFVNGARVR